MFFIRKGYRAKTYVFNDFQDETHNASAEYVLPSVSDGCMIS